MSTLNRSRNRHRVVAAVGLCLLAATSLRAIFVSPDLDNVPVARLVANLEQQLKAKPNDFTLQLNLGRIHAMAWAQRTETIEVASRGAIQEPWFGFVPLAVPFTLASTNDPAKLKAAAPHLDKALLHYGEALKIKPDDLVARLGYAWLTEQTGDKTKAVGLYRSLLDAAWSESSRGPNFGRPVYDEAAAYLVRLLDPQRDAGEITRLNERRAELSQRPRAITPIAIPLRDGLQVEDVVDLRASVRFDADGSGIAKSWTWITPDAGWLVYNQRERRSIDSALQLFGNVTFWLFWDNGYEALRALDDNGDRELAGPELAHMAIWRDANHNGVSESDELKPLSHWGIVGLSSRYEVSEDGFAAAWSPSGVTLADGHTRPTWDVLLRRWP